MKPLVVLGTRNCKKGQELFSLLAPLGIALGTLADFPESLEVEETGATFAENARLKAAEQAKHLKQWVLGEDSGLAVEALQGAPGVYSARYSGDGATDASNNEKLLAALSAVPLEKRAAYYVCHAVLADSRGEVRAESTGRCGGRIRFTSAGSGGFGYDPLFEIVEYHRTFGELSPVVKAALSHRARAIRQLVPAMLRALST